MDAGLLTIRPAPEPGTDERALAYWDACGVERTPAVHSRVMSIRLLTVGEAVDVTAVETALRTAGFAVDAAPWEALSETADLTVVLCDDYLNPALAEIDRACRSSGRQWLLAKPTGVHVWVGPVFQPGVTGCWHCLATRLWGHRHAEACAQAALGREGPAPHPVASLPASTAMAANLVSLETTKWLAGHRHPGQRGVRTLDTTDLSGRLHELRARPQCSECGDVSLVAARTREPVVLRSVGKVLGSGSGHRSSTPEQVLDKYQHLISPVTGVVKEIKRDRNAPELFNSFRSGPNFSAKATGMDTLRRSMRDESGGKGVSATDAKASALCEALERYSGRFHGDEERIQGTLRSLGDIAVHPNECMLFHQRQYATRLEWNAAHAPFQHVCEPFDECAVTDWTPVWSLTWQRQRLLPTGMLYYGAPAVQGCPDLRADSNGNAAGSSLEDAIVQGLLELVERDAVALWWYNRTPVPGVDLDAFHEQWIEELRWTYTRMGREIWVLDVTSDINIPVMVAMSRRIDSVDEHIMFGFGAHFDPRIALRRALTELNQLTSAAAPNGRGEEVAVDDPDAWAWWRYATVRNQPYLIPDADEALRVPESFDYVPRRDLAKDIESVVAVLSEKGLDTLVLDQTRPDIDLPVVKMIVPGMRHFWARFGNGRLYEVPVELGRLTEPTAYEELNPFPLFL
ncbi:TOMM precursor leader peptide-binding protein [Actinopolyspora lacussalsi]|uniref:TOMM precursor leader peptide-binding protein n=1 Tax=Actinopolyspora righensis TaxID=995060 RepID=UPI001C317FBF|nr:TOMM precursor leader peptide-binding protein [Actinopolyspora righensis]